MSPKQLVKICLVASLAVLTLAPFSTVRAEDATKLETIDVVASGVGMNETEATKDALGNAVRQAIGAIVGTDSLVRNEDVIRDQILTYSDGFVEKYEAVGKPTATLNGLTSMTIRARVVRSKLIQKVKAANIYVVEVDGKGMFAEAVTKIEQKKSARALISDEFKDMPQQLIAAEIMGQPRYDEKSEKISATVRLAVDKGAYEAFTGRLMKLLDGIGGPSFTVSSEPTGTSGSVRAFEQFESQFPMGEFPSRYMANVAGRWNDPDYAILAVCATYNSEMTSSRWRMYVLEPEALDAINAKLNCLSIGVEVLDGNNKVIDCRYLPLGKINNGRHLEGPITFDSGNSLGDYCQASQLFIAPLPYAKITAMQKNRDGPVFFRFAGNQTAAEEVQFDLKPDDLAKVAKIVCKVSPASAPAIE